MHTSARSAFLHCSGTTSVTSRTAVYGPVRTVVWQGSAGDCRPYADQTGFSETCLSFWPDRQQLTGNPCEFNRWMQHHLIEIVCFWRWC
jgi:hypothetical protein